MAATVELCSFHRLCRSETIWVYCQVSLGVSKSAKAPKWFNNFRNMITCTRLHRLRESGLHMCDLSSVELVRHTASSVACLMLVLLDCVQRGTSRRPLWFAYLRMLMPASAVQHPAKRPRDEVWIANLFVIIRHPFVHHDYSVC